MPVKMNGMKVALIANPNSGRKNARKVIGEIENRLRSEGITLDLQLTRYHGHAEAIVRRMDIGQVDAIVSVGGDGTNYHVLNGLLRYHPDAVLPPLGIIPLGRGNSFALDLPIRSVGEGIDALIRQRTRPVDVCRFTQGRHVYYFVNLMGIGFVTDVAGTAARFNRAGDMSYVIGVFYRLMGLRFYRMDLEIDGETVSGQNCFVEICNSRYTGGNMLMAPDARIDDGWFDVVVTAPLSRVSLIATLPKIFKGTHGVNPAVRFIRGTSARISTGSRKTMLPDGEIFGFTPTDVSILPHRVRYFC